MKKLAFFFLLLPYLLLAQEKRWLRGEVIVIGENGEKIPQINLTVTFKETGDSDNTNSQGTFRVFLPDIFKVGEKITLLVDKPNWRIQYPLDGEVYIPAELEKELVEISLLPIGSKLLWTNDRIEKFIEDLAEKAKPEVDPKGITKEIDFGRYIQDWAVQYGFSAKQAKKEIDKWVADIEKKQNDSYKLGLAAFAKKNFSKAGEFFKDAAEFKVNRLNEIKQEKQVLEKKEKKLIEELIRDRRLEGNAYYNDYQFDKALATYQLAAEYVTKEQNPKLWAAIQNNIGNANWQLGIHSSSDKATAYLNNAILAHQSALEIRRRETNPEDWAETQINLGQALAALGEYEKAIDCLMAVLKQNPNDSEAFQIVFSVLLDKLHDFSRALALEEEWLKTHPEDIVTQVNISEGYFVNGQFAKCIKQIDKFVPTAEIPDDIKIALYTIKIASIVALNKAESALAQIDTLSVILTNQPENFAIVNWSFEGTKDFIEHTQKLAQYRDWLLKLFRAVESKNRDAILAALLEAKAKFQVLVGKN